MYKKKFFNVLDFGSSKVRFSVFDEELNNKFSKTLPVFLNRDFSNHFKNIKEIIKLAEKEISTHIQDIILILDRSDLLTVDISLKKNLGEKVKINKTYDLLVLELNQLVNSYYSDYEIIHTILEKCIIDDKIYNELPNSENKINNLKIDFKIICYPKKIINDLKISFNQNNLNLDNIFCTTLVKSLYYLRKLNLENVCFLEIGWERTSFVMYKNGAIKLLQSIPVGGYHISKDISKIFKITTDEAEKIKKSFNKSDTEFSYNNNSNDKNITAREIIIKNISIDKLKEVILYRIQEIIDLTFKKLSKHNNNSNFKDTTLFLIGEGSILFNDNSFYLNDKFEFKSINCYEENDKEICNAALVYLFNNHKTPKINHKNQGLFEKFFNFFSR